MPNASPLPRIDLRETLEKASQAAREVAQHHPLRDVDLRPIEQGAARFGRDILQARGRLRRLAEVARHLRSMNVEDRRARQRAMVPYVLGSLVVGVVAGAVLMYVFDPRMGRRRRILLAARALEAARSAEHFAAERAAGATNRAREMAETVAARSREVASEMAGEVASRLEQFRGGGARISAVPPAGMPNGAAAESDRQGG